MTASDPIRRLESLTARQKEVLRQYCQGNIYKDIGETLFISEDTVKAHMGNIYKKLGLDKLPPKMRTATIFEIYCPLLAKRPPEPVIEDREPSPVTRKIKQMVEEDENALVLWEPAEIEIIDAEIEEIPQRSRRRGSCILIILGIILGAAILGGIFFALGGSIPGIGEPTPTVEDVAAIEASQTSNLPTDTPVVIIVTATPEPETNTPEPSSTSLPPATPTKTSIPSSTPDPNTEPGSVLGLGEWWKKDGLWLRVYDYEIQADADILIYVEAWNKTDSTLTFSWNTTGNFSLSDNNNYRYQIEPIEYDNRTINEIIEPGEIVKISNMWDGPAVKYNDQTVFNADVRELILTVEGLSRIDKAQFKIELNK